MLITSAVTTPHMHAKEPAIDWHTQDFQEFVPQSFENQQMVRGDISYSPFSCAFTRISCCSDTIATSSTVPFDPLAYKIYRLILMSATIRSALLPVFLQLLAQITKPCPLIRTPKMLQHRTFTTPTLSKHQPITCTGRSDHNLRVCSPISAQHMTFSYRTLYEKIFRRNQRLHARMCRTAPCQSLSNTTRCSA